jgi:predicted dehydrogenase
VNVIMKIYLKRTRHVATSLMLLIVMQTLEVSSALCQSSQDRSIRLGIIGLDTSHVVAFTKAFNDPGNPEHVSGARVVAAFKGGSPDVDASRTRIDRFTNELRDKWKIEMVDDIPTLCQKVDGVLLESVDGRAHLEQVKSVLAANKPVFIDKPLAASYKDAVEIARLAKQAGVPWFSSSSMRFWEETQRLKSSQQLDSIVGCDVYGPSEIEPHHPDLMWYGIHAVEMLYTIMGTGCESVTRVHTADSDVVIGKWKDGRLGGVRGIRRGKQDSGITLFTQRAVLRSEAREAGYRPLLMQIVKFFQNRVSPVNPEETLEMFAFMEAADISKIRGGAPVPLSEVTR